MTFQTMMHDAHYQLIQAHYGDRCAERSGVPLMAHIDQGLAILDAIEASQTSKQAYCLHPLVQDDRDLIASFAVGGFLRSAAPRALDPCAIALALEYRWVANLCLSHRRIHSVMDIRLSPLSQVNDMLVADKVQNRKDFERYHRGKHPRSAELEIYFDMWLERLAISQQRYQELIALL